MAKANRADALKQSGVQTNIIGMLRQYGLYLLGQRIHLVVGLGRQQVEENSRHTRQQTIVTLILLRIDNGIVEGRFLRIVDNLLYLFIIATNTLHEGLFVVLHPYTVEGYHVM